MGIFQIEPTIIFRIFENVLVFLIKPRSYRKIEKQKQKTEREGNSHGNPPAGPPGGPALC